MPRPAVRVEALGERRGERRVRLAALVRRRRSVGRRARERVAEREQLERDRDEAGALGGASAPRSSPSAVAAAPSTPRSPESSAAASASARRAAPGSASIAARERALDARLDPERALAGRDRHVGGCRRQLDQRQRVAERRLEQAIRGAGRQRAAGVLLEHRRGRLAVQPLELERGQERVRRRGRLAGAHREQRRDRVGEQPPGGEQDRGERRLVDPVGVVDRDQQRLLLGVGGEQAQRRRADQEAVALDAGRERRARRAARRPAAAGCRRARRAPAAAARAARRTGSPPRTATPRARSTRHALGARDGVLEQRGLADPGLAGDDQDTARAQPRAGE